MKRRNVATSPPVYYEYSCFLSYTTREDEVQVVKPFIDDYRDELQREWERYIGVNPRIYYDGWRLPPGLKPDEWLHSQLEKAIRMSAFVVAFVSPGYLTSGWCNWELSVAHEEHTRRGSPALEASCLPILWKDTEQERRHPFLANRAGVDIRRSLTDGNKAGALMETVSATIDVARQWFPSGVDRERPRRTSWLNYIT
jgi:hypothetical protein